MSENLNVGYNGIAMCLPHIYWELERHYSGGEWTRQKSKVMTAFQGLVMTTRSLGDSLLHGKDEAMVKVSIIDRNHTEYSDIAGTYSNIQYDSAVMLRHTETYSEVCANLLTDVYVYSEIGGKSKPSENVHCLVERVESFVSPKMQMDGEKPEVWEGG